MTMKSSRVHSIVITCVLLGIYFGYKAVLGSTGCDMAVTNIDSNKEWILYMSESFRPITEDEILYTPFSDSETVSDTGVACDPAIFYHDPNLTNFTYIYEASELSNVTVPPPENVTMLNITCKVHANITVQPTLYPSLQSFAFRCMLGQIPDRYVQRMRNLRLLDLSNNNLTYLSAGTFTGLYELMILMLNNNPLVQYDPYVLCNLDWLFSLNMINSFNRFPSELFAKQNDSDKTLDSCYLPYIRLVRLNENNFTSLPPHAFYHLSSLFDDELLLCNCDIEEINPNTFADLARIKYIALEYNSIQSITEDMLAPMVELRDVYVRGNNITSLNASIFPRNQKIGRNFDFSNNALLNLFGSFGDVKFCQFLNLSHNSLEKIGPTIFANQEELSTLLLNNNKISYISNLAFSELNKLTRLDLSHNRISILSSDKSFNLISLELFIADNNNISFLSPSLFRNLSKLHTLKLHSNQLQTLDTSILFSRSASLLHLSLHDNPWYCNCSILSLKSWILHQDNKNKVPNIQNVTCNLPTELTKTSIVDLNFEESCKEFELYKIVLIAAAVIIVMAIVVLCIAYKYRRELQVLCFIKFGIRLRKRKEDETESPMLYDAFVSYSSHDEDFVMKDLMRKLEQEQPNYKLCLHFRDFEIGVAIAENISKAIEASSRTILLVSRQFLRSEWCKYEFQQAHYQVLSKRANQVILILMEDIPNKEMESHLRSYIRTHTYLHVNDKLFWQRLKFALPNKTVSEEQAQNNRTILSTKF